MNDDLDVNALLSVEGIQGIGGELVELEKMEITPIESNPSNRQDDLADDYTSARNTLNTATQLLTELAMVAVENARASESARTIEVATGAVTALAAMSKDLLKVHKEMREITSEGTSVGSGTTPAPQQQITAQNVFVGTPAELMSKVGSQYDAKAEKVIESEAKVVEVEDGAL